MSETRTQNTGPYPTLRRCTLENGGGGCSFLAGSSPREREVREEGNAEKQSRLSWSSGNRVAREADVQEV